STAALLVMLWCLGAKIGCNEELLANLGLLGFKATFIAIGVIIGSLFFLWLLTRFLAVELPRIEEDN
ncbi:MAG TPA: LysO family transporter, partial [Candidatus Avacidaminococcus intestinavium]|nr:LysO family transporter [Candidatus Avacidaminococcus intestinavium]